jgi:hypothetical protein
MIDVKTRLYHAVSDPVLREAARLKFAAIAPSLFSAKGERTPPVSLRASDAGQCVRKLWNQLHGNPETVEPETQLSRFDIGESYGAWMACLLAAELEADAYTVECEPSVTSTVNDVTVSGHIDVYWEDLVVFDGLPQHRGVVEYKSTYWSGSLDNPADSKQYQVLQAGTYARAKGCDVFQVVTFGPAVYARGKNADPSKLRDDGFLLSEWEPAIDAEWQRLKAALADEEPVEDAKESWRCRGCQVVACVRNPAASVLSKLTVSVEDRLHQSIHMDVDTEPVKT